MPTIAKQRLQALINSLSLKPIRTCRTLHSWRLRSPGTRDLLPVHWLAATSTPPRSPRLWRREFHRLVETNSAKLEECDEILALLPPGWRGAARRGVYSAGGVAARSWRREARVIARPPHHGIDLRGESRSCTGHMEIRSGFQFRDDVLADQVFICDCGRRFDWPVDLDLHRSYCVAPDRTADFTAAELIRVADKWMATQGYVPRTLFERCVEAMG